MLSASQIIHIKTAFKRLTWLVRLSLLTLTFAYHPVTDGNTCTPTKLQLGGRLTAPYHTDKGEGLVDQHLHLIFKGLNCQLELLTIPTERALQEANRGLIDGDFVQLDSLDTTIYKNLLLVKPSYFSFFMAYVSLEKINYAGDLSRYRVGVMTGMPLSANALSNSRIIRTRSYDQLMTLLQRKRIEIAVLPIAVAYYYQKKTCLNKLNIDVKPELKINLYIYLNKKPQALVKPLGDAIKNFKHSRSYQKLMRHFLKKGLNISAPKCS